MFERNDILSYILTWRLNSQRRHAGLDPASSALLDSRLRGNDESRVIICRSNITSRSNKKPSGDQFPITNNYERLIERF